MTTPHGYVFTITGRPISKKNSRRIIQAGGRPRVIPSKAYVKFHVNALEQLMTQRKRPPFTGPVYVKYTFHIKGKYRVDVDNLMSSINDCLEDAYIIENDNQIVTGEFHKIGRADDWHTEITIAKYPAKEGGE